MTRLLRSIVYNWPLKLAAIALATLLYAGLVVSQSSFEFNSAVPIVPLNRPDNAVLLVNLPPVNRIRYVANGEIGAPPTPDSFRATIDLRGVDPRAGLTYVKVDVVSNDPRFLVVDYEPRGINVQLDPFTSKEVPVRVNTGQVPGNLEVRAPVLDVDTVTVRGPESVVNLVVAAQANVVIDPQGLAIDRDVPLIPVDILGNAKTPIRIEPESVHVRIAVFSNRTTKSLAVNPVVTGTLPTGYVVDSITVTPPIISVEGDPAQLSALTAADTEAIPIGALTGTLDVDIPLALPSGVLPVGRETVNVRISVKPEAGTRAFDAALVLTGRQAGREYALSAQSVLVYVGGPLADLDRLEAASFTVELDVGGLAPGVHVLTPKPNLQAGLRLLSVDPPTITVTVTASAAASAAPSPSGG